MLKMVDKEYIRKLHYVKGWPIRKISRELWVFREEGVELFRPSQVRVERYQFKGSKILHQWNEHLVATKRRKFRRLSFDEGAMITMTQASWPLLPTPWVAPPATHITSWVPWPLPLTRAATPPAGTTMPPGGSPPRPTPSVAAGAMITMPTAG